jgi:hypothetical protein
MSRYEPPSGSRTSSPSHSIVYGSVYAKTEIVHGASQCQTGLEAKTRPDAPVGGGAASAKGHPSGENIERLFEAFYSTKAQGMGLRISRSIVEAHGGRLWAAPNAGPGATFFCALPAHESIEFTPAG